MSLSLTRSTAASRAGAERPAATGGGKVKELACAGWVGVDAESPTREEVEALGRRFGLHELEVEDVLSARQRNKVERQKDHVFAVLRFPRFVGEGPVHFRSQVCIFLGAGYVVTVHDGSLPAMKKVWTACEADRTIVERTPSYLVYRVLDALIDGLFPFIDGLSDDVDALEDAVFDETREVISSIAVLRRKAHFLRTSIVPLKRAVAELSNELMGRDKDLVVHLRDVNDHVEKVWERLEELRETIEIYKDTDFLLGTAKTNRILAILTIAFTLGIPATVIGTFYGMNIPLPGGAETGPWEPLGIYTTFIVIVTFSLGIPVALMLWIFRRWKWV